MVKIITDSAADIPRELAEKFNIEILPFLITIDGKQILADKNLLPSDFYKMVESCNEIPSTCQMSPSDIEEIYQNIGKGTPILHITMSSNGSGVNNTANLVASRLNDEGYDITVFDSQKYAFVFGCHVVKAAEMANEGKTKDEIIEYLKESFDRNTAYFLVDDLSFLRKGGRIKATSMAISTILDIKPILYINDGLVEAFSKVRGTKKALSFLVDYIEERIDDPENAEVMILDSDAKDKVKDIEEMIRERIKPKKISYADIGPIITSHAGTGLLGVYFKHKKPYTDFK